MLIVSVFFALALGQAAPPPASGSPSTDATPATPVPEGYADIKCVVTADGRLTDCVVTEENPKGFEFGEAALKLSKMFKLKTTMRDGRSVVGSTYRTRIRFKGGATPAL